MTGYRSNPNSVNQLVQKQLNSFLAATRSFCSILVVVIKWEEFPASTRRVNTLKAPVSGVVNPQGKYPYDVIIVNVMRHWTVVSLGCSWMQWMNSDIVTSTVKAI